VLTLHPFVIVEKMSKRDLVENEILASELRFSKDVALFLDTYIRPIVRNSRSRNPCLREIEALILECSLEKVYKVSSDIIRLLENEQTGKGPSRTTGRIFIDESEHMRRAYVEFVSGYHSALDLHQDLLQRRKRKGATCTYATFVRDCTELASTQINGRTFADFFILPVQRIPRYRLLLQELLRRTSTRFERAFVKEALKRVSIIADEMNYRLRKSAEQTMLTSTYRSSIQHDDDYDDHEALRTITEEVDGDVASSTTSRPSITYDTQKLTTASDLESKDEEPQVDLVREEERPALAEQPDKLVVVKGEKKEFVVETFLERKGWNGEDLQKGPSANVFLLYALAKKGNPWDGAELASFHANDLSQRLYELYCDPLVPLQNLRPAKGDYIVCGPIRSGQSPVLYALNCFRTDSFPFPHSIVDDVGYLQWDDWNDVPATKLRILKSHGDLKQAFGGVLNPALRGSRPEWKVVVTLRHPVDLRLSYFRHVRRVFRKMNPGVNFDRLARLDEFSSCLADYEQFVADVLKVALGAHSPQLLIVFYEEMLCDPLCVVEKVADFVGFEHGGKDGESRESFLRRVAQGITSNPLFVGYSSRVGSSHQGHGRFSKLAMTKFETEWDIKVREDFKIGSYEKLYCQITGRDSYSSASSEESTPSNRSLTKTRSFSLFRNRSGQLNALESESSDSTGDSKNRGGSFQFLGRITGALSFTSSSEHENSSSHISSRMSMKDKDIDPDDSDDDIPDDLVNFWNQAE
jgi:hypothetical protein